MAKSIIPETVFAYVDGYEPIPADNLISAIEAMRSRARDEFTPKYFKRDNLFYIDVSRVFEDVTGKCAEKLVRVEINDNGYRLFESD